jgi:hypothetical protein
MVCGALARAARQQGQRRLLAWRQALAEVQSAPEQQRQQQQQHGYWAPAGLGGSTCSTAAWSAVGSGLLASAAAAGAPGWQQQLGPQQLQQRRGMALNFVNFRPRRRDAPGLPNRRLPDRNEQIRAPEVGLGAAGGVLLMVCWWWRCQLPLQNCLAIAWRGRACTAAISKRATADS